MTQTKQNLKVDIANVDHTDASRRRAKRLGITTDAAVRNIFGVRSTGKVIDVSPHGCQIELRAGPLRIGQFVSLRVGKLEPWVGMVRWGECEVFGIEFVKALEKPVIDRLAREHPLVELS